MFFRIQLRSIEGMHYLPLDMNFIATKKFEEFVFNEMVGLNVKEVSPKMPFSVGKSHHLKEFWHFAPKIEVYHYFPKNFKFRNCICPDSIPNTMFWSEVGFAVDELDRGPDDWTG